MVNRGKLLTANQVVTFTERERERESAAEDLQPKTASLGSLPSVFIVILIIYHVNFSTYESVFPKSGRLLRRARLQPPERCQRRPPWRQETAGSAAKVGKGANWTAGFRTLRKVNVWIRFSDPKNAVDSALPS